MPLVKYIGTVQKVDSIPGSQVSWEPSQVREVTTDAGNLLTVYTDSFMYTAPGVLDSKGNLVPIPQIHPCYHFHGFAGDQMTGDPAFFDKAAGNHAMPGVNLSNANLWATPGYVSTMDPATGSTDSVLRMPAINFDYAAGEKLIVWMLGKWNPEVADTAMIGDGSSTTLRGWHIRVRADGRVQPVLYGALSGFGGSSAATVFDGTMRDFGVLLDGQNRKYCIWANNTVDTSFSSGYMPFSSGVSYDTKSTNTVNIGAVSAAPGSAVGIATTIRACVILRLPASYPVPSVESMTAAFRQLRANPGKLILASAF
jgi:hypothetical protein